MTIDPTAVSVLQDPSFANDPECVRRHIALALHQNRLMKVLHRLRQPVCFSAARSFLAQSWISQTQYDTFMATHTAHSKTNDKYQPDTAMEDPAKDFKPFDYNDTNMNQADGEPAPIQ